MMGYKESYQQLADRYCKFSPEFPIIEQITDHRLRQKLHSIYGKKFVEQYKGKGSMPCKYSFDGAREYDVNEVLDPGNDLLQLITLMTNSGGKIHVN
jgi:hypothetical protein